MTDQVFHNDWLQSNFTTSVARKKSINHITSPCMFVPPALFFQNQQICHIDRECFCPYLAATNLTRLVRWVCLQDMPFADQVVFLNM